MPSGGKSLLILKLLLPLLALVYLNSSPSSYAVVEGLRRSRIAAQAGFHHQAAQALRLVVEREPWRSFLWEQIGREELAAARIPEAVAAFKQAQMLGQLSPEGHFQLIEAHVMAGNPADAELELLALLDLPEAAVELKSRAFDRLAQLRRERGDFAAAVEALRSWRRSEPGNPRIVFLLGLHLTVVSPDEAVPLLVIASRADSAYTPTMQKIRRGLNLAAEAEDPGYEWVMIGRALGSAGEWDLAAEAFRLATIAVPHYAEAWAFLAEAHYQTGSGGREELDRAVALSPESTIVRTLVALDYRRRGRLDQALVLLEDIARQEPDEPIWVVELANTQAEAGDLPGALASYARAVELAPANSLYWQYLARFSVTFNMDVRNIGLPAARKAVILAPDDPAALDTIGWVMVNLADFASAERFLQQAIDRDATFAPALLHLAQLYIQQQDLDRAYAYLQRAAHLGDQDSVALVARRLLEQYYGELTAN